MNLDLSGKNAFICGASQGIGRATAIELSKLGAHVTLVARNRAKLEESLGLLYHTENQKHDYVIADFSKPDTLNRIIATHIQEKRNYHILVNNTGGPKEGTAFESTISDYAESFTSHLLSAQVLVKSFVPFMKQEGYGRIINITSIAAKQPIVQLGISNTIRAAVCNWGKSLSNELGEFEITVNNILPGYTDTQRLKELVEKKANIAGIPPEQMMRKFKRQVPLNRVALPKEIGGVAAFLASPAAGYINGVNLPVDGGRIQSL